MKAAGTLFLAIAAVVALIVVAGVFYVIDETEQVVITQFGKPVGDPVTEPGLKMKVPFIQKVNRFKKLFLEWDGDSNELPTKDKRFIHVDTYARWSITDPLKFFQRLRDERGAQSRLDDILDGETRNTIAKHNLIEVVRSTDRQFAVSEELDESATDEQEVALQGRAELEQQVLEAASSRTSDLGIAILDFRFKRINYVEKVRREVYARMIAERKRIAEEFRSEGAGESARITGEKERELKLITSEAYREAEEIKGKADAEAADIYAAAYNRDPEFYRFNRTMEMFRTTFDDQTLLMLGTDGEFLRYLENSN